MILEMIIYLVIMQEICLVKSHILLFHIIQIVMKQVNIENYLEIGTDNLIPTFDEVLGLFEEVNLPLIIELKCYKDNHKALAEAVAKRLDSYKAPYCIESFDPRAVYDYKNLRPDVVRGQLSGDMVHDSDGAKSYFVNLALTNLWDNLFTKPDFVAYDFQFRNNKGNQKWIKNDGLSVYWTIRSKEDLSICEKEGSIPIFEKFDPEK